MLDFGKFCYLDPQRSGSTFIRDFLLRHTALPIVGDLRKHQPVRKFQIKRGKLFFISAREPLDAYKSIYAHGLRELGGVRSRIAEVRGAGFADGLYDDSAAGFHRWLSLMLDPELSPRLFYPPALQSCPCGFLSWRLLRIAIADYLKPLARCRRRESIRRLYRRRKLHGPIIRTETLNRDLSELVRKRLSPYMIDADAALAELAAEPPPINRSSHRGRHWSAPLPEALRRQLAEREWLYAAELGYNGADEGPPQ